VNIPTFVSRILLGVLFATLGLNGLIGFLPAPGSLAQAADTVHVIPEHFAFLVYGTEIGGGALLLIGRFTPLAIALLAPAFANSPMSSYCFGP
jgi:uncharacterized membrane protein YphA (DoxX/SURF4 family)